MSFVFSDPLERVKHVKGEVLKVPGKKSSKARYTMIQCPFHPDGTPSGQVKHDTARPNSVGYFTCRGCGTHMRWNDFAASQNLVPFLLPPEMDVPKSDYGMYADELLRGSDDEFIRDNHSLYPLNSKTMHMLGLTEPVWRTFPFKFLSDIIGARVIEVHYERNSICYVYLPVMINGSLKGYVKALPEKPTEKGKTSYLNARGSWSSTCGLLGYDSAMQLCQEQNVSTVVLVEGPRDALRLLQHDIPAMAILGTQTWSSAKVSMLALSGVQNVIICTDGDNAGTAASKMLYYGVRTEKDGRVSECATPLKDVFNTSVFSLKPYKKNPEDDKEKIDPCAAPEQAFVDLKECIS